MCQSCQAIYEGVVAERSRPSRDSVQLAPELAALPVHQLLDHPYVQAIQRGTLTPLDRSQFARDQGAVLDAAARTARRAAGLLLPPDDTVASDLGLTLEADVASWCRVEEFPPAEVGGSNAPSYQAIVCASFIEGTTSSTPGALLARLYVVAAVRDVLARSTESDARPGREQGPPVQPADVAHLAANWADAHDGASAVLDVARRTEAGFRRFFDSLEDRRTTRHGGAESGNSRPPDADVAVPGTRAGDESAPKQTT